MTAPRFEIVRTDAGFHARFRAANGRLVWSTEVYKKQQTAWRAIYQLSWGGSDSARMNTRTIDEREATR